MAYEIYKKIKSKKEYFNTWDSENYKQLTSELKEQIYSKYVVKAKVFKRDVFRCQNKNCINVNSPLTLHHIKFRKNGGDDKIRNCVTLCRACHMSYHKGKIEITFNCDNLPNHINGHTFKIEKEEKIDWKQIKSEMNKLRKKLKNEHGIILDWKTINLLMKWLHIPYEEWDD